MTFGIRTFGAASRTHTLNVSGTVGASEMLAGTPSVSEITVNPNATSDAVTGGTPGVYIFGFEGSTTETNLTFRVSFRGSLSTYTLPGPLPDANTFRNQAFTVISGDNTFTSAFVVESVNNQTHQTTIRVDAGLDEVDITNSVDNGDGTFTWTLASGINVALTSGATLDIGNNRFVSAINRRIRVTGGTATLQADAAMGATTLITDTDRLDDAINDYVLEDATQDTPSTTTAAFAIRFTERQAGVGQPSENGVRIGAMEVAGLTVFDAIVTDPVDGTGDPSSVQLRFNNSDPLNVANTLGANANGAGIATALNTIINNHTQFTSTVNDNVITATDNSGRDNTYVFARVIRGSEGSADLTSQDFTFRQVIEGVADFTGTVIFEFLINSTTRFFVRSTSTTFAEVLNDIESRFGIELGYRVTVSGNNVIVTTPVSDTIGFVGVTNGTGGTLNLNVTATDNPPILQFDSTQNPIQRLIFTGMTTTANGSVTITDFDNTMGHFFYTPVDTVSDDLADIDPVFPTLSWNNTTKVMSWVFNSYTPTSGFPTSNTPRNIAARIYCVQDGGTETGSDQGLRVFHPTRGVIIDSTHPNIPVASNPQSSLTTPASATQDTLVGAAVADSVGKRYLGSSSYSADNAFEMTELAVNERLSCKIMAIEVLSDSGGQATGDLLPASIIVPQATGSETTTTNDHLVISTREPGRVTANAFGILAHNEDNDLVFTDLDTYPVVIHSQAVNNLQNLGINSTITISHSAGVYGNLYYYFITDFPDLVRGVLFNSNVQARIWGLGIRRVSNTAAEVGWNILRNITSASTDGSVTYNTSLNNALSHSGTVNGRVFVIDSPI